MLEQDSRHSRLAAENHAFALDVIATIEDNTGLSIRDLFEQNLSPSEIRKRMQDLIVFYVEGKLETEVASDEWPLARRQINVREALFENRTMNVTPNISVTESNYNILMNYQGSQIDSYIKRMTNGLKLLNDTMNPLEAAAAILGSGIASFSTVMICTTAKALIQNLSLRQAVAAGVKAMGSMTVVVGVALLIITELLLYLMFKNKKEFLGIVFNNTSQSLVVRDWWRGVDGAKNSDLFMNTGSMVTFMESNMNENLDSPLIQIVEKYDVGDLEKNLIAGAIFKAEKNFGFSGTEGAMVFSNYNKDQQPTLPRFALVFACPYTSDNGVNVLVDTSGDLISAKTYFDRLYQGRGLNKTAEGGGYRFTARCAAPRGGEAAGIAFLSRAIM